MSLIGNVSLDGNMMLNTGPRANGEVPYKIKQRLEEMSRWLANNGSSIYGSGAFDLNKGMHDWGNITCKVQPDRKTLVYLHVHNWPLNRQLTVTGIQSKPLKAYLLADKHKAELRHSFNKVITIINLPQQKPDDLVSTIVLESSDYPAIDIKLVAKTGEGGYSLKPGNLLEPIEDTHVIKPQRYGTIPAHVKIEEPSTFRWWIYVEEPVTLHVDASYNYQGEPGGGSISMETTGNKISKKVIPTSRFVGEPNSNWHIDSFNSNRIGILDFTTPGYYDITLSIEPTNEESVDFQWLRLQEI